MLALQKGEKESRHAKILTTGLMAFLVMGCYLPMSGGALEGRVVPLPQSLDQIVEDNIIQLETRAGDAYSVNLWVVEVANHLHVFAGDNKAG